MIAAALAALLLARGPAPDLAADPSLAAGPVPAGPRALGPPALPGPADQGPFAARELLGAGAGLLAGDAAFLALATGAYFLVTTGTIDPTVENFRRLGLVLAAAALTLPPLGATLGGRLAAAGPAHGRAWKAFLLSLVGHAAALVAGYYTAPVFWAIVPVQLLTMTTGTSLGLHWGRAPAAGRGELRGEPPAPAAPEPLAWARPACTDGAVR